MPADSHAALDVFLTHQRQLLDAVHADLHTIEPVDVELPGQTDWVEFQNERRHTGHLRRVFVAKYNPGEWGEPLDDRQLWDPWAKPQEWLWDAHLPGRDRPANSSPGLRAIRRGDLVVVMRLRPTRGKRPVPDPHGYNETILIGVWVPVLVHRWATEDQPLRELRPGLRLRVATQVFHVPLVRFSEPVRVRTVRNLDPQGLDDDVEFSTANVTVVEVKDPDGGRVAAARLLAACSLPAELLTCRDPLDLRHALGRRRTGMRTDAHRYWRDMRYRHTLRTVAADAAMDRSCEHVLARGFDFPLTWDHQYDPRWGGDYECWRPQPRVIDKLAVEVKGTRHNPWLGYVKLQQSQ